MTTTMGLDRTDLRVTEEHEATPKPPSPPALMQAVSTSASTSIPTYLQGIDSTEVIDTVHARRPPMVPVDATLRL